MDLARASVRDWAQVLTDADALINCAGALQDGPRDDLAAVHVEATSRLIVACAEAGVKRFVHISAAGVAEGRATAFNATKLEAETRLRASDLDWVILRPGLVIAPMAYGGTALLRGLAALPFVIPVAHGDSVVQVVAGADVADAAARAMKPGPPARISADVVSGERLTLTQVVTALRAWLGLRPAPVWRLPAVLAAPPALAADALAWLGWRSPMRSTTLEQLRMGVEGDPQALSRAYGMSVRSLADMLRDQPSGVQERWFAHLYFMKPIALATLSVFWIASGIVGLTAGRAAAIGVLTHAALPSDLSATAVLFGSIVDIALGAAAAFRRTASVALKGMMFVSAAYLIGGSILTPSLWLDPLGPLIKIVPAAILALVTLAILDER
jgi:uncharacterized protein YbjT (DUF2867 family)